MSGYNFAVDELREREYPQLKGNSYLDHGGTTLPAKSMIDAFATDIKTTLYGNPHSKSTPSHVAGERIDDIRLRALQFFNADRNDFDLIFVANATAAIKLVMDCFRDAASFNKKKKNRNFWYGYHRDAHNSVVGVRELTNSNHRCFEDDEEVDKWMNDVKSVPQRNQLGLFAYPGQSNMTGRRLPLSIAKRIRASHRGKNTYTLLDAAALAVTTQLDLNKVQPDFATVSFYKIFGFPNLGALIVRKASGHTLLQRRYFGGGTVDGVTVLNDAIAIIRDSSLHDRLEDGTLPFHSIFALDHAMTTHKRLYISMSRISAHTNFLAVHLFQGMVALRHSNGSPLFQIYKEHGSTFGDSTTQGSTIAFNVFRSNGEPVGYNDVEKHANDHGIYIRSGGLCNPGGIATHLKWSSEELHNALAAGLRCSSSCQSFNGKMTGVVRVSLGAMTTKEDVNRFLKFAEEQYVDVVAEEEIETVAKPIFLYLGQESVNKSVFSTAKSISSRVSFVSGKALSWSKTKDRLSRMKKGFTVAAL